MARTSCDSSDHCRDGHPCQSCRSVLSCPAPQMCHLSTEDQYVCEIHQGIAEAVTSVLGSAQFPSGSFYHPRSSCRCFGHPRETSDCAGNVPDANGISDDYKRRKRSHQTEPVPTLQISSKWHQSLSVRESRETSVLKTISTSFNTTVAKSCLKPTRWVPAEALWPRSSSITSL